MKNRGLLLLYGKVIKCTWRMDGQKQGTAVIVREGDKVHMADGWTKQGASVILREGDKVLVAGLNSAKKTGMESLTSQNE